MGGSGEGVRGFGVTVKGASSLNVNRLGLRYVRHRKSALTYPSQVVDLFAVQKERLIPIADDASRPRCHCESGSGRPVYQAGPIYAEMIGHRGDPGSLFAGSEATLRSLRSMIENPPIR